MPTCAETQSESSVRRVTGVMARHRAAQVDVCRSGTEVALHISTRQGIVIVLLPEVAFVKGCRGTVDFNGNPFRTIEQIRESMLTPEEKAAARQFSASARPEHPRTFVSKPGGKIL